LAMHRPNALYKFLSGLTPPATDQSPPQNFRFNSWLLALYKFIYLLTYFERKSARISDIVGMNRKQSDKKHRYQRPGSQIVHVYFLTHLLTRTSMGGRRMIRQLSYARMPHHTGVFDAIESAERVM